MTLLSGYIWDILRNTIEKTLARTETVREELRNAEEALEKVPEEERQEAIPEVRRVNDRRASLDAVLREQKEFFLTIFQVRGSLNIPAELNAAVLQLYFRILE